MFDIGFLELLVILVIALLVIGPERMPEVARKLGSFMGKTKRFINSVKEEGEWQETVRDLKQSMDLQEERKELQKLEQDLQGSLSQSAEELDLDSLTRPTFGGSEQSLNAPVSSQFSKAPAQPVLPKQETAPSETSTEQSAHTADAAADVKTNKADAPDSKPTASKTADTTDQKS